MFWLVGSAQPLPVSTTRLLLLRRSETALKGEVYMSYCPVAGIDVSKRFSDMCILSPDNKIFVQEKIYHDETSINRANALLQKAERLFSVSLLLWWSPPHTTIWSSFNFSQSMDMTWSWWIHFKAIRWRTSLSERGKPIVWMPSNWQWCIEQRHCVLPKFLKRQRVRYASSADIVRNCWTTFRVIKTD